MLVELIDGVRGILRGERDAVNLGHAHNTTLASKTSTHTRASPAERLSESRLTASSVARREGVASPATERGSCGVDRTQCLTKPRDDPRPRSVVLRCEDADRDELARGQRRLFSRGRSQEDAPAEGGSAKQPIGHRPAAVGPGEACATPSRDARRRGLRSASEETRPRDPPCTTVPGLVPGRRS